MLERDIKELEYQCSVANCCSAISLVQQEVLVLYLTSYLSALENIFGYTDWNINRPANAWYCMHLWQHYRYTLDAEFLSRTAFPVMKCACEYWFDRLRADGNGKLIAPGEWSPEQGSWEDGVAYAQQLVWQLFSETSEALQALAGRGYKVDGPFAAELAEKFSRLDNGVHVGAFGQIKEWRDDTMRLDTLGNQYRHLSQLIGPTCKTLCAYPKMSASL